LRYIVVCNIIIITIVLLTGFSHSHGTNKQAAMQQWLLEHQQLCQAGKTE